jgi:hypothetical protein
MPELSTIPLPYVVIALLILVILWRSGKLQQLVGGRIGKTAAEKKPVAHDVAMHAASVLGPQELGVLWAASVKRAAEERIARKLAEDAQASMTATYTSPFLPAAGQPQPAAPGQAP